ncbi:MAG TPA: amylo-alpha-1,6-glucosidase [Bryobacteraceae bacterium]|jgi:predicted glycogen debranching enzyme|nr:amylo-alpha-1,6-glucosidase [Bryobacteraceae bacterium]
MNTIFARTINSPLTPGEQEQLLKTEWLVTNGMGGYASGTLSGTLTRVFHGYLVAALPAPLGRTMILNDVLESISTADDRFIPLNGLEVESGDYPRVPEHLTAFRLESGLPVWTYDIEGTVIEKRLCVPHGQNTTYLTYRVLSGASVDLQLRPLVNMREHEASVDHPLAEYTFTVRDHHYEVEALNDIPPLRLKLVAKHPSVTVDAQEIPNVVYDIERSRGYTWRGNLWSPGYFTVQVEAGHDVSLVASTESWDVLSTLSPQEAWDAERDRKRRMLVECHPNARDLEWRELVWGADQFLFRPVGRQHDTTRARAAGDEIRSVIAGYHWFTDWGRDTMISLEGLTLVTGRQVEASYILRTFAHYIRDGLIPNMFPEGKNDGLYHTADATLWFFHAANRYFEVTDDRHLMKQLLPYFIDIVKHHMDGTRFNIHVDPQDGLLVQGVPGLQLTWMDAKVDDWVVTPRRGKAVEINALWYNTLRLLEGWLRKFRRDDEANAIAGHAERARKSFNEKFWNADCGYLYDVVESDNGKNNQRCRPNQIFAISLENPVLDETRWEPVLRVVQERLLTPYGLRSLAPGERDYKPRYDGDLRSRDAAYHQGTVWAWLIGPFIDAWLKVNPGDLESARGFLQGFRGHLESACVGSISEIFDAEPPFTPRGCCAQAWSVAEVLRAFVKTGEAAETGYEVADATSSVLVG